MADVSKDRLRKEITAILKNADLNKTSAKKVRQQLEEKLDVELTDQKKMVDELVMEILKEKQSSKKKNESEDEDEEEEENGDAAEEDEEEEESDEEPKKKKPAARKGGKRKKGSDDDEEEEDEEYSPKKKAPAKRGGRKKKGSDAESDDDWAKKNKKKGGGGGKKGGGGYTRPLTLSPELATLIGEKELPRHEVVKRMWALIKERNLYDQSNKQFAICDEEMLKVIGIKRFRIFGMMKYLKNHFKD